MKISELMESIENLSIEQKTDIVYDKSINFEGHADFALLLGGNPVVMLARVKMAAKIFHEGKADFIVSTGGVYHEIEDEKITEAKYMTKKLIELDVPEEKIIIENEARTTKENMICSLIHMHRIMGYNKIKKVVVVTSPTHLKRSVFLAKRLFPKNIEISGICSEETETYEDNWAKTQEGIYEVEKELSLLKCFVDENSIDDFEFAAPIHKIAPSGLSAATQLLFAHMQGAPSEKIPG